MRENVARLLRDLTSGRIEWRDSILPREKLVRDLRAATIVDSQTVYDRVALDTEFTYDPYETLLAPIEPRVLVTFENVHGNAVGLMSWSFDQVDHKVSESFWAIQEMERWESKSGTHEIDWDRVRWTTVLLEFAGGESKQLGRRVSTTGPIYAWTIAVYGDGSPADIRWLDITYRFGPDVGTHVTSIVFLQTLNFLNCSNIDLAPAEPRGDRAARRRLARAAGDLRWHELVVRPVGKRSTSSKRAIPLDEMPLHTVRGHFHRYGPDYNRGLLFGKLAGRFYIPPHARGNPDRGVVEKDYRLDDERDAR
jgi:hypothetical protein